MHHFIQYSMVRSIQESRRDEAERIARSRRYRRARSVEVDADPGRSVVDDLIEAVLAGEPVEIDASTALVTPLPRAGNAAEAQRPNDGSGPMAVDAMATMVGPIPTAE